jgi:hypothetical protein
VSELRSHQLSTERRRPSTQSGGDAVYLPAGQTVSLKFTGAEDSSLQTLFVVDDTALNVS